MASLASIPTVLKIGVSKVVSCRPCATTNLVLSLVSYLIPLKILGPFVSYQLPGLALFPGAGKNSIPSTNQLSGLA